MTIKLLDQVAKRLLRRIAFLGFVTNQLFAQGPPPPPGQGGITKANFSNVLKLNAYADNWCMIYINGKLAAVDAIEFLPTQRRFRKHTAHLPNDHCGAGQR